MIFIQFGSRKAHLKSFMKFFGASFRTAVNCGLGIRIDTWQSLEGLSTSQIERHLTLEISAVRRNLVSVTQNRQEGKVIPTLDERAP